MHTFTFRRMIDCSLWMVLAHLQATSPIFGVERHNSELWKVPGQVENLDLAYGPGGVAGMPAPPFVFIEKNLQGTNEKIIIRDARNRIWEVKFGEEVKAEVFATRLAWALGYYTDPSYYVFRGHVSYRAFENARFELRSPGMKFRPELAWSWDRNPFLGSRELNGLQVLMMLLSDWDNKDAHNPTPNTGVLEDRGRGRLVYYITDWGASMGRWGGVFTREKWDCEEYARQTHKFVDIDGDGRLDWGFKGQRGGIFKDSIRTSDIRWLMQYLGRVRDSQIAEALQASGADEHQVGCFTRSVRARIEQLQRISNRREYTSRTRKR